MEPRAKGRSDHGHAAFPSPAACGNLPANLFLSTIAIRRRRSIDGPPRPSETKPN